MARRQPEAGTPTSPVRNVALDTLLLDPANARRHNRRNVDAIAASLRRFGQNGPLIVDEYNVIVVGNGTYMAMLQEGWERGDVITFTGTPAEARAFAITHNRVAELSSWDNDALADSLKLMDGPLLDVTGFTESEREKLLGVEPPPPDDSPPPDYSASKPRTLFLEYPPDVHEWLMDVINTYKTRRGIGSVADAVVALVASATRRTPPGKP